LADKAQPTYILEPRY